MSIEPPPVPFEVGEDLRRTSEVCAAYLAQIPSLGGPNALRRLCLRAWKRARRPMPCKRPSIRWKKRLRQSRTLPTRSSVDRWAISSQLFLIAVAGAHAARRIDVNPCQIRANFVPFQNVATFVT